MSERGELWVVVGAMRCGKSERIINLIEHRIDHGGQNILVFTPEGKSKELGFISSRNGRKLPAIEIPCKSFRRIGKFVAEAMQRGTVHAIAIDEIHFFPSDPDFFRLIDFLLSLGIDVLIAGLDRDSAKRIFELTSGLFMIADHGEKLTAFCMKCNAPAQLSQRFKEGTREPASFFSPVYRTGEKDYEPRCHECHTIPDEPIFRIAFYPPQQR